MARGINKTILVGNLGDDPETKYTQGGMAVTTCRLATTTVRKNRDGETQERTEWHRVKFFGKLAEIAGEYLRKGSQVYVEGSIRYDEFEGQDGQKRYYTDIIVDQMQMLGGRGDGGGGQRADRSERPARSDAPRERSANTGSRSSPMAQRQPEPRTDDDFPDDDIPF